MTDEPVDPEVYDPRPGHGRIDPKKGAPLRDWTAEDFDAMERRQIDKALAEEAAREHEAEKRDNF